MVYIMWTIKLTRLLSLKHSEIPKFNAKFPRWYRCFQVNNHVSKLICVSNLMLMFPRFVSKLYYQFNFSRSDGSLSRTENVQFTADGILNKPVVFFIKLGAFSLWSFGPQGAGCERSQDWTLKGWNWTVILERSLWWNWGSGEIRVSVQLGSGWN